MIMKNSRKLCSVLALVMAFSMLASGCSKEGGENAEGSETSVVNVIGADSESTEGTILTDDNGEVVTGVNGNPLTEPAETTTMDPAQTLSNEDILNAITGTQATEAPVINKVDSSVRYGYSTLSAEEKKLYDDIVKGVESLSYKICEEDAYSLETWAKVYGMVFTQEPQLFYMNSKVKVGKLFYLTKDTAAINEMQKSIDAVADKLVAEANGKATTFEKLKVFHDYLVLNTTFQKKDDTYDYNESIYNAFGTGAAQGSIQCSGYAKSMLYLCDKAGIACMVVRGENDEGASHAWNIVDVDGKWYNIDCTWDDPILTTANVKNIRYNYFLVPDSWIHQKTHFHINEKKMSSGKYLKYFDPPACTETAENYFVKTGKVYNDQASADAAIKAEIERAAKDGSRTAQIMAGSKEVYDAIYGARMDYNTYSKTFSGVKGLKDECNENMLLIEFDVVNE